jgi:amino acid adenylation domain-containing protein
MDDLTRRLATLSPAKRALLERGRSGPNGAAKLTKRTSGKTPRASFAQERLWFVHQLEPQSSAYNVPRAIRIRGNLDLKALHRSLNQIVARHDTLRTRFALIDGSLRQIISEEVNIELPLIDLSDQQEDERVRCARELIAREVALPFDLSTGPLVRAHALRFDKTDHLLLVMMHHIVSDAWSAGVFFQELTALYQHSPLPPLKLQYADYAEWQRAWLQGDVLEEQLRYWRNKLKDAPAVLDLPTDRPRPAPTTRGATCAISISESLTRELRDLSSASGATLFMTLLSAFGILLHRYSGENDIVIGTPIAGRNREEIEHLIGFFINTLPLRIDIANGPTFAALLARVKQTALEGYEHQDLPFEKLVEELKPERSSGTPFFQVMFQYQHAPRLAANVDELTFTAEPLESGTSKFDLSLGAYERDGVLKFQMEYSTDLFDEETVQTMLSRFTILLQSIVSHPDISVARLPIMSDAERRQLLVDWNNTDEDFGPFANLSQKFERQVAQSPEAVAVVFEKQQLTFSELNTRGNKLAHHLKKIGVTAETPVAVFLERSIDMIVGLLGVLKAGAAWVPLDVAYPKERIAYVLGDSGARVVLTHEKWRAALPEGDFVLVALDSQWQQIETESVTNPVATATAESAAYIIYTSGSTGRPKGVVGLHGATVNRIEWMYRRYPFAPGEVCCQKTSLSFVDSIWEIFGPLLNGVPLVIFAEDVVKDVDRFVDALDTSSVTRLVLVPSLLRAMLATGEGIGERLARLTSWTSSGEALSLALADSFRKHFPHATLLNLYGSSEVAADVTYYEVPQTVSSDIPLGRPIANTQVYILDSNLELVPAGVNGEIYIGGANVARGYLDRPELTAEKFIPDPFAEVPGQRLYKTGDLGRILKTGDVEYRGRTDHQVKIRGSRIELGEIQSALDTHPEIRASIVLAHDDAAGEKRLTAYVLSRGKKPSSRDVRTYLSKKLPEFMIPNSVVVLEEFPKTASGKVDRLSLPKPADVRDDHVAPRNLTEEIVAGLLAEIIKVDDVGINDDFFELGGHSLLIPQVIARLNEIFVVNLPLRTLFDNSRVSELAAAIESLRSTGRNVTELPIVPIQRNGELPLTFGQESLWAIDQIAPGTGAYNIPRALHLKGSLNIEVLQQSLDAIVLRHEVLRTVFGNNNGRPFAVVTPDCQIELVIRDLNNDLRSEIAEESRRPFNLSTGPLLRAIVFRLDQDEHILMVTMHHIISDGWSMNIFFDELVSHYHDLMNGSELQADALPLQYADFAAWQHKSLSAETLNTSLAYWQQQLADAPAVAELPVYQPRPAVRTFQGNRYVFEIPADLTSRVKQLARDERVTLFMTLLGAFQTLLWTYSKHDNIVTGSPSAGRRPGTENLIGYFVNTLVLKTSFSGNPTFRETMQRVAGATRDAWEHEQVPFAKVVEALQTERTLSYNPVFQVWFVLQITRDERRNFPGLEVETYPIDSDVTRHDLQLTMWENSGVLKAAFTYNTDILQLETVSRMAEEFLMLLAKVVEAPDVHAKELRSLLEDLRKAEQQQFARRKLQSARRKSLTSVE